MRFVLLPALLLLVAALAASAQNTEAPSLSVENNILYAHGQDTSEGGDTELEGWMNTLEDDGNDQARGPFGGPTSPHTESRTHTFPMDPPLNHTVGLDGEVVFVVHVGSVGQQGTADVSVELTADGEVVAQGEAQRVTYGPAGEEQYEAFTWNVPAQVDTLEPGTELIWSIQVDPLSTGTFIGVGDERGRSHVVLPIVSSDAPDPTGNGTAGPNDEESPAPGLLVAVGLVAVAALLRRRD